MTAKEVKDHIFQTLPRFTVLGVPFHPITRQTTCDLVIRSLSGDKLTFLITLGTEMVMAAQQNKNFRQTIENADLVVPDGIGLVLAARLAGLKVPERLTGVDLLSDMVLISSPDGGVFFYGAAPGVAEAAVKNIQEHVAEFNCVGAIDGYNNGEDEALEAICKARPKILFVALGFPRQEFFIEKHRVRLQEAGVRVCMGVGGSFDAYAGTVKRAPGWVQSMHIEWLYRLCIQPSRWRRMLALPRFAAIVVRNPKKAVRVAS